MVASPSFGSAGAPALPKYVSLTTHAGRSGVKPVPMSVRHREGVECVWIGLHLTQILPGGVCCWMLLRCVWLCACCYCLCNAPFLSCLPSSCCPFSLLTSPSRHLLTTLFTLAASLPPPHLSRNPFLPPSPLPSPPFPSTVGR